MVLNTTVRVTASAVVVMSWAWLWSSSDGASLKINCSPHRLPSQSKTPQMSIYQLTLTSHSLPPHSLIGRW